MTSGRKERIVISCVTFETVKVTEPILHYEATKVHLIYYAKNESELKNKMYRDFLERAQEIIRKSLKNTVIELHEKKVNDFAEMLRTVLNIICDEKKKYINSDIYVNISAGSSEYAAASTIASMMIENTIPFSVSTEEFMINDEEVRKKYYDGDIPIGLAKTVREPVTIPCYNIKIPEEHFVRALRIFDQMSKLKEDVSASTVIGGLKDGGLWQKKDKKKNEKDHDQKKSDSVYYQRFYKDRWISERWIKKNTLTKKYEVTAEGRMVLDTYYL